MCGICGIYNFGDGAPISDKILIDMNNALTHRGPDDSGVYIDKNIALAHRRLSIIDLENGRQPMANEDNTVWIIYNGEMFISFFTGAFFNYFSNFFACSRHNS